MQKLLNDTLTVIRKYYPSFEYATFDSTPITSLTRPISECRVALVTTGGLHLNSDRPFDTKHKEGDCSYRTIPADVTGDDISISHDFYKHDAVKSDLNCVFPIDRMREYAEDGTVGSLSEEHFSFMGHIYEPDGLIDNAKEVGKRLIELDVDIAFLTPT